MKKIGLIVFAAAIIIGVAFSSLFSFGRVTKQVFNVSFSNNIEGSGKTATETRGLSDFSSVEVGGVFQVEIVAQKDFGVQVEADDNLLQFIKTEVHGDVLKIESDKGLKSKSPIKIRVSAPNIERIEASGASKVTIADLNNSSIDLDTSGASKIALAGETSALNVQISGASNIDAENLKAVKCFVDATGASKVSVNVADTLIADASGASRVTYTGNPTSVQKDISGASGVSRK
jgi:hypothetical protein